MTYREARAAMAQHFRQARAGNPCSCLGAGGRGEMCPDGAGIYAEVVSPSGPDNAVPRYVDEVEETTPVPPETMAVVVAGRLR